MGGCSCVPFHILYFGNPILKLILLKILALLAGLLLYHRRRRGEQQQHRDSSSSFAVGEGGAGAAAGSGFGGLFSANRNSTKHGNPSEKGLLSSNGSPTNPSPDMREDTPYGGNGTSTESAAFLGGGAGAGIGAGTGGLAPGAGPGERTSGVVLPRVKDENQSGDRYIETGANVSVLWP